MNENYEQTNTRFLLRSPFTTSTCSCFQNTSINSQKCSLCTPHPSPKNGLNSKDSKMMRSSNFRPLDPNFFTPEESLNENIYSESKHKLFDQEFQNFGQRNRIISNLRLIITNYNFSQGTFYAAVTFVDAILSKNEIPDELTHLFTYCCAVISAKVNEPQTEIPLLETAVGFFRGTFSGQMIKDMESQILRILGFNLIVDTTYSLAVVFLSNGIVGMNEGPIEGQNGFIEGVENTVFEFLNFITEQYLLNKFKPVLRALAAISFARKLHGLNYWSEGLMMISGLRFRDLFKVMEGVLESMAFVDSSKVEYFGDFYEDLNDFGENRNVSQVQRGLWQETVQVKMGKSGQFHGQFENERENYENNTFTNLENNGKGFQNIRTGSFVKTCQNSFSSISNLPFGGMGSVKTKTGVSNSKNEGKNGWKNDETFFTKNEIIRM